MIGTYHGQMVDFVIGTMERSRLRARVLDELRFDLRDQVASLRGMAELTIIECANDPREAAWFCKLAAVQLEAMQAFSARDRSALIDEGLTPAALTIGIRAFKDAASKLEGH